LQEAEGEFSADPCALTGPNFKFVTG